MAMKKFRILAALMLFAGCASMSQQKLTDRQIAMVMRVANLGEVRSIDVAPTIARLLGLSFPSTKGKALVP